MIILGATTIKETAETLHLVLAIILSLIALFGAVLGVFFKLNNIENSFIKKFHSQALTNERMVNYIKFLEYQLTQFKGWASNHGYNIREDVPKPTGLTNADFLKDEE